MAPSKMPNRRQVLGLGAGIAGWTYLPRFALSNKRDPRFLVVILRGGLDGLSMVSPLSDPHYSLLRPDIALSRLGTGASLPLDGFFWLNGAMPNLHRLYRAAQVAFVHAVATPYRDRSHFAGQDVLESGFSAPGTYESGWLNRVASVLPAGEPVNAGRPLAIGASIPLILRGPAPVSSWAPSHMKPTSQDTVNRLLDLYDHTDGLLSARLRTGLETDAIVAASRTNRRMAQGANPNFVAAAIAAAELMKSPTGARLATISYDGWDTHFNEGPATGRLSQQLSGLDQAIGALEAALGQTWEDSIVAIVTEFGRTAAENGSDGTDHGTGTVAVLVGGAVRGGRVVADWPGLSPPALFEGRDLAPTIDLRAVLKGVLADHLGLSERVLGETVFPGSENLRPLWGLVA